jgi:hypothetical protein
MSASISIREYIRWLPDQPSEPTTTVVLTSPEKRFVDIRVFKEPDTIDGVGKQEIGGKLI